MTWASQSPNLNGVSLETHISAQYMKVYKCNKENFFEDKRWL